MGLFCLSLEETPEAQLNSALRNLEMFRGMLEDFEDIRDKNGNQICDYLIGFAESQIKSAIDLIKSAK